MRLQRLGQESLFTRTMRRTLITIAVEPDGVEGEPSTLA